MKKVISGHQTGVDRGAIDAARRLGIETGGWVPRGRRAEDGVVPEVYICQETESFYYTPRTVLNVTDSDGTLIVTQGASTPGTNYTIRSCQKQGKPYLIIDLDRGVIPSLISQWMEEVCPDVLNVAGPRESSRPGIQRATEDALFPILMLWRDSDRSI